MGMRSKETAAASAVTAAAAAVRLGLLPLPSSEI